MIFRSCAGGVVFYEDKVFLLKNEKSEWVLPKGVVREKRLKQDVALERVKIEAGLDAEIVSTAGDTSYEFYSLTRRQPVCNKIVWYVMKALGPRYRIAFDQGFTDGDWYPVDKAVDMVTYSQDKAIVRIAYSLYQSVTDPQS